MTSEPVVYRSLRAGEQEKAIDLWVTDLTTPGGGSLERDTLMREFLWDSGHLAHTYVAVARDGTFLSAFHYAVRTVRDGEGMPRRAGLLGIVATRADARQQGHGGRLIQQTIAAMERDGCAWSILFTADAAGFYERHGWRGIPVTYRQGYVGDRRLHLSAPYSVRPFDPEHEVDGWAALAAVYDAYNTGRPLTLVRDLAYWREFAAMKFTPSWRVVFVATRMPEANELCGYVLAAFSREGFVIDEIGVHADDEEAIPALLSAVVDEARRRSHERGRCYLPREPRINNALRDIFGDTQQEGSEYAIMARAVTPAVDARNIDSVFTSPSAFCWPIDDY